jgi:methylated-DNA-[protein]-cysteine S-methyltransferase
LASRKNHDNATPHVDLYQMVTDSPVGRLTLVASDRGLRALLWPVERPGRVVFEDDPRDAHHPIFTQTTDELAEYFEGKRRDFTIPLDPVGTEFQRAVWRGLCDIPLGETRTYGALARDLGRPKASRAVGAATGRNPISILIPCHRLVGSKGALTGFAGGLETKRWLLAHEGAGLDFLASKK